jgi:small subunit ribosomal protein S10
MAGQKIRIRLKAYDHEVIDKSARKIVDTVAHRREGRRSGAAADGEERLLRDPFAPQVQGQPRALRDAHAQAPHRHHRPDAQGRRLADASRPAGGVDIEIKL